MEHTTTHPRRPLSEPEDTAARRGVDRWEAHRQRDDRETPAVRPVTFNSVA